MAPPGTSPAPASGSERFVDSIDSAAPPEADAEALIATSHDRAYREARDRQARAREAAAHWDNVARIIARRGSPAADPASDAGIVSDREDTPPFMAGDFSGVRQVEELERILNAKTQPFRLQFFAVATDRGASILSEFEFQAADASQAIRAAAEAQWPARAIGLRLIDLEGREIFEQLRADRR